MKTLKLLAAPVIALPLVAAASAQTGKYAEVNGLKMYYEVHGAGRPLVLLHGAFGLADGWSALIPTLAKNHLVIVPEMQGHGHTADRDAPLSYAQMAEDTAALLASLKIKEADVFGYSMGGSTAFRLASAHPSLVRKLITLGAGTGAAKDTFEPASYAQFKSITPETFNFPEVKDPYTKVAPDPSKWPVLVSKVMKLDDDPGMTETQVKAITAETLVMMGDREGIRLEHALEVYRQIAKSQLAVFPKADHFLLFTSPDKVLSVLSSFLDAE